MAVGLLRQRLVAFLSGLIAALALVSAYIVLRSQVANEGSAAHSESPDKQNSVNVKQAITALGRLEPRGGVIRVAAPSDPNLGPAIVRDLRIKEGDRVEAGQIIAVLDHHARLEAAAREAQAKLRVAKARVAEAKARMEAGEIAAQEAEVNRLQAEYDFAAVQYRRYKELFQSRFIAASDLDERRTTMESQAQKLQQAKGVLSHLTVLRTVEIQSAEAERDLAAAALARAEVELRQASIRSPISGRVIEVFARAGESADGRGIAAIGDTDQMYAIAEVYESDAPLVRLGQQALVWGPGIKGQIAGVVEEIGLQIRRNEIVSTEPAVEADVRVVKVKIRLEGDTPVSAFTNMRVTCSILL